MFPPPLPSMASKQKPSIYETRVVKKFFEQHDDPATTSGISDYVQQVKYTFAVHKSIPSPCFCAYALVVSMHA